MNDVLTHLAPFTLSGAGVGFLIGLTGVGGGSLMTPLLTLGFAVPPTVAVGTDLAFAAATKGFGTLFHREFGHVQWPVVRLLALGSLPAAGLTLAILSRFGEPTQELHTLVRLAIASSVLLTAVSLLFRKQLVRWMASRPGFPLPEGRPLRWATIGVGATIGALVTLSSIGAGAIGATLILLLHPRLNPAEVAGTDIAHAVPLTALAGLGHWWLGNVHAELLAGLLMGSIPGIWVGTRLSRNLPERYVRMALATTLALAGIKLAS